MKRNPLYASVYGARLSAVLALIDNGCAKQFESNRLPDITQEVVNALTAFADEQKPRPTYDQLIRGAKLTDEHRAEIHREWNKRYEVTR